MCDDLQKIYEQYVIYHQSFRQDFLIHCGAVVSPEWMPTLLTIDGFAALWQHWHENGTQADWSIRFGRGYSCSKLPFSKSIRAVLVRSDAQQDDQLASAA